MTTKVDNSHNGSRIVETFISGTVKLTPIEYQHIDEAVLAQAGYVFGDDIPLDYCARIVWDSQMVIVTIGDYIIAEWQLMKKAPIVFGNQGGYGPNHLHSHIKELPTGIISDIVGLFWPAL